MHTVQHILDKQGPRAVTIDGNATVLAAARLMNEWRSGALVVTRHDKMVGIVTERDVLNRVVAAQRSPDETPVKDVMTTPVSCCRRDTPECECRELMRIKRIRHLTVVENSRPVGIIGIGDIIGDEREEEEETIEYLNDYLYGSYR